MTIGRHDRGWASLLAAAGLLVLAACDGKAAGAQTRQGADAPARPAPAIDAAPDLARCPTKPTVDDTEVDRTEPLPVPAHLAGIMRSDLNTIAVTTLTGETYCINTAATSGIEGMRLSPDGRFLSFTWYGYEVGGFIVLDRAGKGMEVETGAEPVASPSGRLLAAVEYSESGFGTLNGLGIWRVKPDSIEEVSRISAPEGWSEWRFEGWRGEDCVKLSAIAFANLSMDEAGIQRGKREVFTARPAGKQGWALSPPGGKGCLSQ